ncbi:efflux RND transporter permease subunit [Vibrio sonorensis]|uniref:efflux RND transporter permease subunit n=1 Tax=Vibrio sonorensis TaxID=1004316 RepID=UPI0008D9EEAC|nr:efflux RND transporter permease subunit [Vibrio sonorensis]
MENKPKGLIAYFANNAVAANLMMVFIIVMGIVSYFAIQKQFFPNIEFNYVHIRADYPGASPQEVEENVIVKVEESLKDVLGIKRMVSTADRGHAHIELEIELDSDVSDVVDKVKLNLDTISTFPAKMEPISVYQEEWRQEVVELTLTGDVPVYDLKPIANQVEEELLQLSNVSLVTVSAPEYEIGIEVEPKTLQMYNLTLKDVSDAIGKYSANFSAGEVRTNSGLISVRIENQLYKGEEFGDIPVIIGENGNKVLLRDIAVIKDGLIEGEHYFESSGQNAIYIAVKATKDQSIMPSAASVKAYLEHKNEVLPEGIQLNILSDMTYYLDARLQMMLKNLMQGAALVAIMLSLFLRFRLAFWVMIGLPVCFLGAIMMMPLFGVTINVVSLFAFIMVLGIVVDDAIVIGESAYTEVEKNGGGVDNVVRGAKRVATPATFGVLTTIAVFAPFLMSKGIESAQFIAISTVVILCLVFSLIESKLILPAHIAHTKFKPIKQGGWRDRFNKGYFGFVNGPYRRAVSFSAHWRWSTFAVFASLLAISIAMVTASHVRVVPSPSAPQDFPRISIEMNNSVSDEQTIDALKAIESMMREVEEETIAEFGQGLIKDTLAFNQGRTRGMIVVPLVDDEIRPYDTFELSRRWRERMPEIPGVKKLIIIDDLNGNGFGDEFGFMLFGSDIETLNNVGREVIGVLQQQEGLFDISSSIDSASQDVLLSLTPVAYDLGLDLTDIALQVGGSFYGGEAQRVTRDGEEVKVMVRYPQLTREAFSSLRYAIITTDEGRKVMLGDVVNIEQKPGVSSIRREDGYQSVYVYGSIDEQLVEPNEIIGKVHGEVLPSVLSKYPGVKSQLGGSIEEQQEQLDEQRMFFIAGMIMVYILLAVPLKSYAQPLLIMSVIPFSLTGAIWGHFFFGIDLSMMSTFGLVAAAGVVVNDSLVMTDYVNTLRKEGMKLKQAVVEAGCARFRAITLTSITTFVGVLPIMFETSMQAKLMIPMAVALGFSVLFATLLTLILVPCLYLMLEDIKNSFSKGVGGVKRLLNRKEKAQTE